MTVTGQATLPPEQLQKVKAATVFIKVQGPGVASTGSGFVVHVDGTTAYVVTNSHVIDRSDEIPADDAEWPIEVVFNSGEPSERTVKARVAAADLDPTIDLAVLRVTGVNDLPDPLDVTDPTPPMETMPVFVCGFPFGGRLAVGEKNPEISIGPASVSSIRRNALGTLAAVELTGALNPGNSGGPVVSAAGKVVGVAVSTVRGAGLGRAIPAEQVAHMLRGRIGGIRLVSAGEGIARLEVGVIDPLRRVTAITAHYKPTGDERPPMKTDISAVLPEAMRVALTLDETTMTATASVKLPDAANELLVQIEMTVPDATLLTVPAPVALSVPQTPIPGLQLGGSSIRLPSGQVLPRPTVRLPPASEDDTLTDLIRNPASFVGQFVTFDALSSGSIYFQGETYELVIETDAERAPTNLRPVVPKDLALQLADLGIPERYKFSVRLTGQVQKPIGRDNRYVIEVTEIGFLNRGGSVETIFKPQAGPSNGEPSLLTINRFPERFVGQKVAVDGYVMGVRFAGRGLGLDILNPNGAAPLNLEFYAAKDLHNLLANEVPVGGAEAKLTVTVDRVDAKTGRGIVGVSRVELPNAGSKPKTFASREPIAYPPTAGAAKPKPTTEKLPTKDFTPQLNQPARPAPVPAPSQSGRLLPVVAGLGGLALLGVVLGMVYRRKTAAPPRYRAATSPDGNLPRPSRPVPRPPTSGGPQDEFPGFDFEKRH
jgi:hypothetical protein